MPPIMEFYTQSVYEHRESQINAIFSSHPFFLTHSCFSTPLSDEENSAAWHLFVQLLLLGHRKSLEQTELQAKIRSYICDPTVFLPILDLEFDHGKEQIMSNSFFENLIAVLLIRKDFKDHPAVFETIDQVLNQADWEMERFWEQANTPHLSKERLDLHLNKVDIVDNHLFLLKEDLEINSLWNGEIAQFFKDLESLKNEIQSTNKLSDHQLKELMQLQKIKIFPLMKWQLWIQNESQSIAAFLKSHVYTKTMMAFAAAESRIEILPTLRLWANDEPSETEILAENSPSELSLTIHNGALFLQWLGHKEVLEAQLDDSILKPTLPPSYLYDLNFRWWYLSHQPGRNLLLKFADGSSLSVNISEVHFPHS